MDYNLLKETELYKKVDERLKIALHMLYHDPEGKGIPYAEVAKELQPYMNDPAYEMVGLMLNNDLEITCCEKPRKVIANPVLLKDAKDLASRVMQDA